MALQFVLGGSGRGKTSYLQHLIISEADIHPEQEYLMIVPEQFTMQTQKDMASMSEHKGIINVDVQSFVRLAFRVFSETGAGNKPVLDDMGKTMILKKVLMQEQDKLTYFGRNVHKKGYIAEIKSFLSELIQYDVDEEGIQQMIESAQTKPALSQKLKDMSVAYSAFNKYIEQNYITSEEVLTVLADVVHESNILKDCIICLDGFTGFTPLQYKLIEQLMKVAKMVYVTVTVDDREQILHVGAKHRLFYMSRKTIYHMRKLAEETGTEICPIIWTGKDDAKTRYAESEMLSSLERNLFRYPSHKYTDNADDISIHLCKQPEDEVAYVVQEIGRLLRNGECRYRDIAIVTADLSTYGVIVDNAMNQAGMPCFIDQKKSVLANPFVAMIDSLMQMLIKDFAYEDVISYLKGRFTWTTMEQTNIIDNFLLASGIRGHNKWQEKWECGYIYISHTEASVQYVSEQLDSIRCAMNERIMPLYDKIARGRHSVREISEVICAFLEQQQCYTQIMEAVEEFREHGQPELAGEYEQIYGIVINVFDRLVELLGDENVTLAEFKEILDVGFTEARIGLIPPGVDQIVAGDLSRTRISDIKYLFFLGINDGNIPKRGGGGGILSDSERTFLSGEEYELAPTTREQVYTEQFYLYLCLTKPSRHLYVTYCETGTDGRALEPSYLIDRLLKQFPKMSVNVEENRTDELHVLSNDMGRKYLIRGLRDGDYSDTKWQELYSYYASHDSYKGMLSELINAAFYRENKSQISQAAAKALYHDILRGSTSQMEKYAACAFSYYMQYGLRLEERQEHQIEFFDIGNIVHEALEIYTDKLIESGKRWQDMDEQEQHVQANQCINEVVENYKNGLMYDTERDTYMISRLRRLLLRTVWAITEQMKLGEFDTVESEFSFDTVKSGSEDNDDLMKLVGRIDRIDSMQQGNNTYVRIVDYKTGKKEMSLSDLYHGLQMQLIIYLKASMENAEKDGDERRLVIPAGVLYYNIDDPILEGRMDSEDSEKAMLKSLKMRGIVNEDDPILPAMDSNFQTDSGELPVRTDSIVAPFGTDKDGHLKKTSAAITTGDFGQLIKYTEHKILKMADEIMSGNTEVNPYTKTDSTRKTACDYCSFRGICRFDVRIPGNNYRTLSKLTDDDVFMKIGKELNGQENQD